MHASFNAFVLFLSAVLSAYAVPLDGESGAHLSKRGGSEICTNKLDGTGGTNDQVTKDCCAAVDQSAFFDEIDKICSPLPFGSVDTGAMVDCCASRGCGSHEL